MPIPSLVGKYGKFLGESNFILFGYFSYFIPFYLMGLEYAFYKNLDKKIFERFFAGFIAIINILIIQSMLFSKGIFGNLFVDSVKPLIGVVGLILLVVGVFVLVAFILKLEIKLPKQKQISKSEVLPEEIKPNLEQKDETIEDEVSLNIQDNKKESEKYIQKQMEEIHKIDDEEHINISKKDDDVTSELTQETQNIKEDEIIQSIKEEPQKIIQNKEEEDKETKIDLEPKPSIQTEIEEIKIEEVDEIVNNEPTIDILKEDNKDNGVVIVNELDENKELLNSIEIGTIQKPTNFKLPSLDFLVEPPKISHQIDEAEIDKKVQILLNKLRNFKVDGDVVRTYTGPVVTTFEFKPLAHIKVSKILNLADDLAMALKASTIRIQAPVPGKDVVGIEIPNSQIETIYLREILETDLFKNSKSPLVIALGKDIVGKPFVTDLAKLPHVLIAGTTGSGKSVGINSMILSLLYRNSPDDLKLMMIDPKMLEFSIYNEIPHLLTPVITEAKKAITGLNNMVKEMERRYKLMSEAKVKNIENYNEKYPENKMPYIVVIIDELADLMMTGGKDVEYSIGRLAQMARASGIHLIVATQRPSVDVVTGTIKANLPSRMSFKVGQKIDSKVVLDQYGAESLLGRGDMLFTPPGTSTLVRLHAPFTTEEEIEKIVEFLKSQRIADYDENFLAEEVSESSIELDDKDELFEEAKQIILNEGKTSISYLQRRLQIGYNRAANIVEQLERSGFLSAPNSKGQREIL